MSAGRDGRIVTFYSYKGGTGRTMALANTAWILAANGKRVLAVDWDLEAPGLHRFFHPFLDPATLGATTGVIDLITEYAWAATSPAQRPEDWHRDYARIQPHAVSLTPESLGWEFPQGGTLDFVSAGRQNREYSATVSTFDWDNFYDRFGGGHFFDALRDDMKANYDYVLIDSRTGLSDIADICTVHLPDVLVDCFTLSDQSIDGAASVARQIAERNTGRPIALYPVPMRIDEGEKEKADAGRALARLKFDRLPRDLSGDELTAYWGAVEIPYRPYYAYEETLATFGDEAGLTNSLLSAFERLVAVITDREITSMPPIGDEVRLRIRDAFTRRRPAMPADLFLSYVAENRMWADWLESILTRAGFRVVPRDVSAERSPDEPADTTAENAARTVVLLSSAYLKSQRAVELWERTATEAVGSGRRRLVPLRIGDVRLSAPYIDRNPVDLFRLDEVHATTAVMRALDRPVQVTDGVSPGPRFPGTVPRIWNAPPRNPGFTGRSLVLERMRDQLGGGLAVVLPQPQTLYGLGGVGKTQVALEYVHRFMADYDLVWWISSEQTDDVVASLAELAVRLVVEGGDGGLELVVPGGALGGRRRGQRGALGDGRTVPGRPVLGVGRDQLAVRSGACRGARLGEDHQRQQPRHAPLVGQQPTDGAGQPDRLAGQVGAVEVGAGGGGVALVEDQVEHLEHGGREAGPPGEPERDGDGGARDDPRHDEGGDQDRTGVEAAPVGGRGGGAHVASPGVSRVMRVSCRARSAAVSWSRPAIRTAPLAEAVVTVTVASRKICSSGPRTVSTV